MTQWSPIWDVSINGVSYTTVTLANLSITSGRSNIYIQAQAGYATINLINLDGSAIVPTINDSLSIQVKDTSGTYVPIFGGSIVDVGVIVSQVGSVGISQTITITALGALSRLQKALTNGVLTQDFDGDQILTILSDLLLNNWSEVPSALTWATYDPTATWATAENVGLGEIDTPGNYELAQRSSSVTDVYSLVAALATSGLGYLYEDAQGRISYADSTHRSTYLAANGYTDLDANQALGQGIKIQTRAGDIRNDVTIKYNTNSSNSVNDSDPTSIGLYGDLAQIITTTIKHQADAESQAAFYLTLRAYPQPILESITFALTNPELDNADRDALINAFMGQPISLSNLPLNMAAGTFLGFIEGWRFSASYNELSITLLLSPLAYSLQAMKWEDVSVAETWNTLSPTLDFEHALVVA
ncbi:hypothetical protein UFOVP803_12 [uncultured Caudovirales phage]|uniref:Uncharacterized protein n=1 Tax=uncultured Caudovirales phage TaxID=2100421 RepID=A0A6J5NUE6_9CAUD|nr:hypothetical protein UFOVP803_12 [uncultured Caudovirales phage]